MPTYNDGAQDEPQASPPQNGSSTRTPGNAPRYGGTGTTGGAMDSVPAPATSPSRAVLQLARNHRSAARCVEAVQHYESLIRRFAGSPEVPAALMESADCYRRMGRLSAAERNLRRARQFASTRASADRELRRIATVRSAQRRAAPSQAAPSQQSEPASAY